MDGFFTMSIKANHEWCVYHFEVSQFINPAKKGIAKTLKQLHPDAVPTIFDVQNKPSSITLKRKLPTNLSLHLQERKIYISLNLISIFCVTLKCKNTNTRVSYLSFLRPIAYLKHL